MSGLKRKFEDNDIDDNTELSLEISENQLDATFTPEIHSGGIRDCSSPYPAESAKNELHVRSYCTEVVANKNSEAREDDNAPVLTSDQDKLQMLQNVVPETNEMDITVPTMGPQHKITQKKMKIKNPSSVWMIFSNENRDSIYKEFPLMNFTEGLHGHICISVQLQYFLSCYLVFYLVLYSTKSSYSYILP